MILAELTGIIYDKSHSRIRNLKGLIQHALSQGGMDFTIQIQKNPKSMLLNEQRKHIFATQILQVADFD